MSSHFEMIAVSSSNKGFLDSYGENEGIRVIPVKMTRKITPWKDLKALYKLYKIFKNEKPWMVHTHTPKAGTLGMIAAYFAGVPNRWHTIAGLPLMETKGLKRQVLDLIEKITYSFATRVLPNSRGLYEFVLDSKYTKSSKLKIIANGSSNGIDTSYFDPALYSPEARKEFRHSLKLKPNDFVLVFIGRLVRDKGINELMTAFNELSEKHSNLKLILIGVYEEHLDPLEKQTVTIIKKNKNVIATGGQHDVRPYLAIADLFVFPSYREGFPNSVMEAGAMGLPSIVSDINGCNEIIIHGHNGLIIPSKDVNALTAAISQLYMDTELKDRLSANARPAIKDRFERQMVWQHLLKEYNSLNS